MFLSKLYIWLLSLCLCFVSCIQIEEFENNPRGNFEALWKIMDERYCFFEYKGVDWNKVHDNYSKRISDDMSEEALFYLLNEMLQELKDGHVNLYSSFDVGRYWKWFEDYPPNFNQLLIDNYLRNDYLIAGGMRYKVFDDNIGYIYYGDFSAGVGESNLDQVINKLSVCDGIIFDVRNNGGGALSNAEAIAARFFNEKTLTSYIQHKTGKGHNDLSEPFPRYVTPSTRLRYQKPVVVLTNRKCYSATNEFVNSMRLAPAVTILGDRTGGGGGLPFSSEMPNGWSVRLSVCPILNENREQIEFGIDPDIRVDLIEADMQKGKDTLIEAAKVLLKNLKSSKKFVQ